ncbi:MAG: NAD(P)/FAD-dependent oxidoreductase [Nitrospira sp.]|nr:NAD(P)/FAD-dependent oxidoreductase [Nitrospira sp.]
MNIAIIEADRLPMAAEVALAVGRAQVALYDSMPSVGRKFSLAGKGGLNLTLPDPSDLFSADTASVGHRSCSPGWPSLGLMRSVRGTRTRHRHLCRSSGRVFPTDMKAAPVTRAAAALRQMD